MEVERESGGCGMVRVVAAVDSGEAVNPDGIRNQIEGGIIQSASWTLYEAVTLRPRPGITSRDWGELSDHALLRRCRRAVEVQVIDRPGQPFLGTGEAAQGPTAAAIANAFADATGVRMREMPLTARG